MKRPKLYADIARSIDGAGPVTIDEAYRCLLATARHRYALPSRRELQGIIRQIPGVRRVSPEGEYPALYEYQGVQA